VPDPVDARLGARLAELRAEHGWSLGELAERSGVSRSILSRAERAEISPTASLLNRLCAVYGRTMSPLLSEVEAEPALLVRAGEQPLWEDRTAGFVRRSVSPPHAGLRGELAEGLAHRRRRHRLRPAAGQLAMIDESPALRRYEESMWTRRSG
jgi:transcriptional regulator with XRE-family HTH domain